VEVQKGSMIGYLIFLLKYKYANRNTRRKEMIKHVKIILLSQNELEFCSLLF